MTFTRANSLNFVMMHLKNDSINLYVPIRRTPSEIVSLSKLQKNTNDEKQISHAHHTASHT